jgi:hypothetical protein
MRALYRAVAGDRAPDRPDVTWRELWKDLWADFDLLRSSQYLVALNAFAFWGLRPDMAFFGIEIDNGDVTEAVARFVAMGRRLLDSVPSGWVTIDDIERTVLAAECRLGIDTDQDATPEQLAALARVSLKSIRNLLTPGGSSNMTLNSEGGIAAAECRRWLESRPDFKSSLWIAADEVASGKRIGVQTTSDVGEVLFVPVARDGSWFDPASCRNARGYTIGPKGAEQAVDDYKEAVARLSRMSTPYWRRPNERGHWGIVSGVSWQRKILSEIGLEPQDARAAR